MQVESMIDLIITDPYQPRLRLRLLAYHPKSQPDKNKRWTKIHVMEGIDPIAEDPIYEDWHTEAELAEIIALSIADGYRFESRTAA